MGIAIAIALFLVAYVIIASAMHNQTIKEYVQSIMR